MFKERYLHSVISSDLKAKMVFIGGPRQVGKTTLAQNIGENDFKQSDYLNWDNLEQRKIILEAKFNEKTGLMIFDELHKYSQWKNYIKGQYDVYKNQFSVLVTGSARLDLYKRGGDSLMGRYHYFRLHPFSLAESLAKRTLLKAENPLEFLPSNQNTLKTLHDLLAFGGFPEPFLAGDEKTLRRFHNERQDRLIREDIRDTTPIRDLSRLQILADLLPEKVGSLFSLNNLVSDLQVTHRTLEHWVDILEQFYYHFRVYPFAANTIKSLRKRPKIYLWDWSQVADEGAKFENLVASHLLKLVHYLVDAEGYKAKLHYLRDQQGREVDFLVTLNQKPWLMIEVKLGDTGLSPHLLYFQERLKAPYAFQIVKKPGIDFFRQGIRLMSADKFLASLI